MTKENKHLISSTIDFVKTELQGAEPGHDWWHAWRVWNNSKLISQKEEVNMLTVELGALLHDIADSKFHNGDETVGPSKARDFLRSQEVDEAIVANVENIVRYVSNKGHYISEKTWTSPELEVVQDADALDALGAIGIARAFVYGGNKNRLMYDPNITPSLNMTKEEYKNNVGTTINHFYEKLLLLPELMKTKTGRELAIERRKFMEEFLKEFLAEWNGKK